jgi:hypothetical protein
MFTLKLRYQEWRAESPDHPTFLADESTQFVAADKVTDHGETGLADMARWEDRDYSNLLSVVFYERGSDPVFRSGHLIGVEHNGKNQWFLVSHAWLLGPDGGTIERLA